VRFRGTAVEARPTASRARRRGAQGCHGGGSGSSTGLAKVVLVGTPNVGKSVIFANLTHRYATVSNYPGTTVEIMRGNGRLNGRDFEVLDTPGMFSLLPITEEERVARAVLMNEDPASVVHVVDAKNLDRMLHLTLQLIEAGLPVVLDLNLLDEADKLGLAIECEALEDQLGVPVVATVATDGRGMEALEHAAASAKAGNRRVVSYGDTMENAISQLEELIPSEPGISRRALALLLLQDDPDAFALACDRGCAEIAIHEIVDEAKRRHDQPLAYVITLARQEVTTALMDAATTTVRRQAPAFRERLSRIMMHPLFGIPILLAVMYGFFELVGVFGAQIAVDFLENDVFGLYINPAVTRLVEAVLPWQAGQDLFVHQYGIITLGIRYAVAIILPIVATFFVAFAILEDSGYLPRLAMLIDRLFKKLGLNGRAVIPIVLGFGCDTMATMVTRTLETKRERVISCMLLSLAVPCSAQMGVILALLAGQPAALAIFAGVMACIFLLTGFLAAKLMPGERPLFYSEIPPLRWPRPWNVFTKTYTRVIWYFKEILPLFILASVIIWIGNLTGLFDLAVRVLAYPVQWAGMPIEAAPAFLFGFFRRDFGAAGLYDLHTGGLLQGVPLLVAVVTLALFMPCIAQFSMTIKERGLKMALGMAAFIFPFAFFVGFLLSAALTTLGVKL